jgi:DNA-binding transcriptional MerR regulator
MLKLFGLNRDENNQDIYESDDNENLSDEDKSEDLSEIIFNKKIFNNQYYSLYECDAREVCINVPIWSSQRSLNLDHIKILARDIKSSGYVMGTFKILKANNEYRIFDGQHRYHALREIFIKDNIFNLKIICELYEVQSFDSTEALTLFSRANNIKNVEVKDTPNVIAHNVCKILHEKYPQIFTESSNRINRPRIDKKLFYQKLKNILDEISQNNPNINNDFPSTVDDIVKSIEARNCHYSLKSRNQFKSKGITENMYNKAKSSHFYLGLENIDDWILSLN